MDSAPESSGAKPGKYADWPSREGIVYFIGAGQPTVAVKIGLTQKGTIEQRLRSIQCANHEPLELLGYLGPALMPEIEGLEKHLHTQFKTHQRIIDGNVGHEWFTASAALLTFIKENTKQPEENGFPRSVARVCAGVG